MGKVDFDVEAGMLRHRRLLSVRLNGDEVWGAKRPLYGALGCLMGAATGFFDLVQAVIVPFEAHRQRAVAVEVMGHLMDGWKRPLGVAAISLGLFGHGLATIVLGVASVPLALVAGAAGAAIHPVTAQRHAAESDALPATVTAVTADEPPAAPQARRVVGGPSLQRQAPAAVAVTMRRGPGQERGIG